MKQVTLTILPRHATGRSANRALRKGGVIPAVIYGESGTRLMAVRTQEFKMAYRGFRGSATLLELKPEDGGEPVFAIIQELQRNPRTDAFLHIDFKEVVRGKPMEADIPVRTVGVAEGVRNYGGVLEINTHTLRVRCLPRHLPEAILIEVSHLTIGKSIHLAEVPPPEGVTFLADPHLVVVSCVGSSGGASAAAKEEAAPGEEGATPAEQTAEKAAE